MLKLAILGSGSGSNFEALAQAIDDGRLAARIVAVVSDVADALILERARRRGLPAYFLDCAPFKTKLEGAAEARLIGMLREAQADAIALAGFMRLVKPGLINAFPNRIINLHPALLPAFPGLHSWEQALEYGAKVAGCTVHFVDAGMDTGPIIAQAAVPILEDDTPSSLHARIQIEEHRLYPLALQALAEGRLTVQGRRVQVRPPPP